MSSERKGKAKGNGKSTSPSLQQGLNAIANGRTEFVAYPSYPFYQIEWVKAYNLAIDVTPIAVVRPDTADDVAAVIKCAAANNVKVQAKSGGHSYA